MMTWKKADSGWKSNRRQGSHSDWKNEKAFSSLEKSHKMLEK